MTQAKGDNFLNLIVNFLFDNNSLRKADNLVVNP
jgi:hypothetical protein